VTVISGIYSSQTAAPAWMISLIPQWPKGGKVEGARDFPIDVSGDIEELSYTSVRRSAGTESSKIDTFEMVVNNTRGQYLDTEWFQEGNIVDMYWGYAPSNLSAHKLGIMTEVNPDFPERGESVIVVRGMGLGCVMAYRQRHGLWTKVRRNAPEIPTLTEQEITDPELGYAPSEIAEEIAAAYGFKANVEYCGPIQSWWQNGESDWAFLQRLAKSAIWIRDSKDVDFCCWVDNGTLYFKPIQADTKRQVAMRMAYTCDDTGMLYSFHPKNSTTMNQGAASETTAVGFDPRRMMPRGFMACNPTVGDKVAFGSKTGLQPGASGMPMNQLHKILLGDQATVDSIIGDTHTAADENSDSPLVRSLLVGAGIITPKTFDDPKDNTNPAEKVAKDAYKREGAAELDATAECVGWPTLEAEKLLDIQCVGSKHSGIWEIDEITHRLGQKAYRCEMKLIRNAKGSTIEASHDAPVNELAKQVTEAGAEINTDHRILIEVIPEVASK
jgi:hypothetical protein